jgi:hypothetical protein
MTNTHIQQDIHAFEQRLVSTLLRGIMAQITVLLRASLHFVGDVYLLYVLVPVLIVLRTFGAPQNTQDLVQSMLLDTLFALVDVRDISMSLVNLLGIYFLHTSFQDQDSNIAGTAQYLVVFRITSNLNELDPTVVIVTAFLLHVFYHMLDKHPRIQEMVQLVSLHLIQNWFMTQIPQNAQLPCLFMIIYGIAPFIEFFSKAADVYNFIIMTLTSALHLNSVTFWIQAIVAFIVWMVSVDRITEVVARLTTIRLAQLAFVHTMTTTISKSDALFVYSVIVMSLEFISG